MLISDQSAELGDLGWGWNPIKAVKKVGKTVGRGVKSAAKSTAKGAKAAYKSKYVRTAGKVAFLPVYAATKVSKFAFDLAVKPIRWQLNKLKAGRANVLAAKAGHSKPTVQDQAQARKDTKDLLRRKGVHGKMLAYLAGGSTYVDEMGAELGAAGVDDAAIVVAAGALTALAKSVVTSAAKSGFSAVKQAAVKTAVDTAKGVASRAASKVPGGTAVVKTAARTRDFVQQAEEEGQAVQQQAQQAQQAMLTPQEYAEQAWETAQVTPEEVEQEFGSAAEEAQQERIDEAVADMGFAGAATDDLRVLVTNPAAMSPQIAARVATAAQNMVCNLSPSELIAIGGPAAARIGAVLCDARKRKDAVRVRALTPQAVQIAALGAKRLTDEITSAVYNVAATNEFAGAAREGYLSRWLRTLRGRLKSGQGRFNGVTPTEITLLSALDGANPDDVSYGLLGAGAISATPAVVNALALGPMLVAVGAGLWMFKRG